MVDVLVTFVTKEELIAVSYKTYLYTLIYIICYVASICITIHAHCYDRAE